MNTDIRLSVAFREHRKRKRLRLLLGPGSTDYLLDLWLAAAMNKPTGVLDGMDETDIALEAGWEGEPDVFIRAMLECRFLERREDGVYVLHDWEDHQGYVVHAPERSAKAKQAAEAKWKKVKKEAEQNGSMQGACNEHASSITVAMQDTDLSNAPSPAPIPSPAPSPKNKKHKPVTQDGSEADDREPWRKGDPLPKKADIRWLLEAWNEIMPDFGLPPVRELTQQRRDHFNARLRENASRASPDYWLEVFERITKSDFLCGRVEPPQGRKRFVCRLAWLLERKEALPKLMEGFYGGEEQDAGAWVEVPDDYADDEPQNMTIAR